MFKNVKKFTLVFLSVILIQTSLTQVVFANEGYEEEDNHVALQNQLENEKLVTIDIINNLEYLNSNEKKEFILDVKNATHVTTVVTIKNHALTKNHKVMMRFLFEQEVVVLKELIKNGPLHEEDRFKLISRIDTISLAFTYEINDVYIYMMKRSFNQYLIIINLN